MLDVGCCCCLSLAVDCWLLVAGCWLLDACCWLVAGCYLLADAGWDGAVDTGRRSVERREQEFGGGIIFGVFGVCGLGGGVFAGCCRCFSLLWYMICVADGSLYVLNGHHGIETCRAIQRIPLAEGKELEEWQEFCYVDILKYEKPWRIRAKVAGLQ